VLEQLEQDVILVEVKRGKTLQIWVVEVTEKHVCFKRKPLLQAALVDVKVSPVFIWPDEIKDRFATAALKLVVQDHMVIGFVDDASDNGPHAPLLLN
jgi:hypothetical protein